MNGKHFDSYNTQSSLTLILHLHDVCHDHDSSVNDVPAATAPHLLHSSLSLNLTNKLKHQRLMPTNNLFPLMSPVLVC